MLLWRKLAGYALFQIFFLAGLCTLALVPRARCGAWPMAAGKGQSISTLTWQFAASGFDNHGLASTDLGFEKFESAVYLEYGLTSHWTLVAHPAAQSVRLRTNGNVDTAQGFAASELSVRRALPGAGQWVLAVQSGVFIPGNVENGFDKPLGEGGLDKEVRILAGRPFVLGGRNGFADFQLAYRQRSRGSGDDMRLDGTLGAMVSSRVQVLLQTFALVGMNAPRPGLHAVDSFKGQFGAVWFFRENRGVQISLARTLYGRNVVRDTGLTLGWWRKF